MSDSNKKVLFSIMGFIHMLDFLTKRNKYLLMKFLIKKDISSVTLSSLNNKKSTFIYSTNEQTSYSKYNQLEKSFSATHGNIIFDKKIDKFPVIHT